SDTPDKLTTFIPSDEAESVSGLPLRLGSWSQEDRFELEHVGREPDGTGAEGDGVREDQRQDQRVPVHHLLHLRERRTALRPTGGHRRAVQLGPLGVTLTGGAEVAATGRGRPDE